MSVAPRARLEIRLSGGPEGEIPLAHLAAISELQEAVLRLGESLAGRAGRRGRSPRPLEILTRLAAVEIRSGSAVLVVVAPKDGDELPLSDVPADVGLQALTLFEDAVEALAEGRALPEEVDVRSRQSIDAFLRGLEDYESVHLEDLRNGSRRSIAVIPAVAADRLRSAESGPDLLARDVATGLLYAVDIKNHAYRIEDDLGKSITFEFPTDAEHLDEIRGLVGARITARGSAEHRDGRPTRFTVVSIETAEPVEQSEYFTFDLAAAVEAAKPIRSLKDLRIPDLDEQEARMFWEAVTE